MTIEAFAVAQLFAFLLVFARIGSGIMLLPGFGEAYVNPQMRLLLALLFSLAVLPMVQDGLPAAPPSSVLGLGLMLGMEVTIGLFIGLLARMIISLVHTVGMIVSYQAGLSAAMMFDTTQSSQGTVIGNFFSLLAVLLLFASGLHHAMLMGLADSYGLFPAGGPIPTADLAEYASRMVGDLFRVAVMLSGPILLVGLMVYLAGGILSRLMPTMQVFFVLQPAQILISFFVMIATLGAVMLYYLRFAEDKLGLLMLVN